MPVSKRPTSSMPAGVLGLALAGVLLGAAGCSDPQRPADAAPDGSDATPADADAESPADADADAGFVIAPHPALPEVLNHGGPVLAAPVLTAVTYDGYDLRDVAEDVIATIGASAYWQATTAEYGVGPAVAGAAVRLAGPAPVTIDETDIRLWLAQRLDGTHPEFGAASANSLYALFFPAGTTVTNATLSSCAVFGGYHGSVAVASGPAAGTSVAYVVIPECDGPGGLQYSLETSVSHELVEAATDPLGAAQDPDLAWSDVDDDHLIWQVLLGGGEVTDLCQLLSGSKVHPLPYAHAVERSWSNAAARAGHDPCVPAVPSETYFAAAGVLPDTVTLMIGGVARTTKGVRIPLGQSRIIEVDLWSDGPADPWTVSAADMSPLVGGTSGNLTFSWDATTGSNGTKLHLAITAVGATPIGGQPFLITSSNGARHEWFGYVGQN